MIMFVRWSEEEIKHLFKCFQKHMEPQVLSVSLGPDLDSL